MSVAIRITSENGPTASVQQTRAAALDAMGVVAKAWHDKYLPAHFTAAGGKKYGYQPRQGDDEPARIPNKAYSAISALGFRTKKLIENWHYSWRKRKTKRHNRPLVWSGTSEAMAKAAVKVTARRRQGAIEASAAVRVPTYFFQYHKAGVYQRRGWTYDDQGNKHRAMVSYIVKKDQPDKYDELTRVAADEAIALTAIAEGELRKRLAMAHERATVTV